jgi:hypothetical protein
MVRDPIHPSIHEFMHESKDRSQNPKNVSILAILSDLIPSPPPNMEAPISNGNKPVPSSKRKVESQLQFFFLNLKLMSLP